MAPLTTVTVEQVFVSPDDPVAVSFWIISIAMVAATAFFWKESDRVDAHWATSLNVGALVTLVAAVHYFYMREYWVTKQASPILYRYIDWSITVPLQMVEFYLILSAVQPNISAGVFWRLLVGTVVMLTAGYIGEAKLLDFAGVEWVGFVVGMLGWFFILYEIFLGEAGKSAVREIEEEGDSDEENGFFGTKEEAAADMVYVHESFVIMRIIVTAGWSIYPIGYFVGYLMGSLDDKVLNGVYNLADFINKIAFCLAIWNCAKKSTLAKGGHKK